MASDQNSRAVNAVPHKSFRIQQDHKFFSRLLSRDTSSAVAPSFRVYYGVASSAVPFLWESQPGTPKSYVLGADSALPPLTPPPSYGLSTQTKASAATVPAGKLLSKSALRLTTFLPKLKVKKSQSFAASTPTSSTSMSAVSSPASSPMRSSSPFVRRWGSPFLSSGSSMSFSSTGVEDVGDSELDESPKSTLCFGSALDCGWYWRRMQFIGSHGSTHQGAS